MNIRRLGFYLGPLLFMVIVLAPPLRSPSTGDPVNPVFPRLSNIALGITFWAITWWITEAVPFGVTALVIALIASISTAYSPEAAGFSSSKQAVSSVLSMFFHRIIWVFWGGLMLAYAMEVSGAAKRIVKKVIELSRGTSFTMVWFLLWFLAWFLSWWISNTAAIALLYPIALSVVTVARLLKREQREVVLLGLAFAASIGGMSTLIGTPPNLIAVGYLESEGLASISFLEWMRLSVPISFLFFLIMTAILLLSIGRVEVRADIYSAMRRYFEIEVPQHVTPREKLFYITFILVVSLWIIRGIAGLVDVLTPIASLVPDDSVPAILASVLLFGLPKGLKDQKEEHAHFFDWRDALNRMDWDTLFLFAGGLIMGNFLFHSGAGTWLGEVLVALFGHTSLVIYALIMLTWGLTQVASNTASANALIPIIISVGLASNLGRGTIVYSVITAALSSSIALTLPVSTPPNAIVFAGGQIRIKTMAKYGLLLSLIYIALLVFMLRVFF